MVAADGGGGQPTETPGEGPVRFEETLSATEKEGYNRLYRLSRILALGLGVWFVVSLFLFGAAAVFMLGSGAGGTGTGLSLAQGILSDLPLPVLAFLALPLLFVVVSVVAFVAFFARGTPEERVHTRITDGGVHVAWEGSAWRQYGNVDPLAWPSSTSEASIPFEDITAVEYTDPEHSSLRIEPGDWRASKYLAGRSSDWVRIERADAPAVYVGSDRPAVLAERIAGSAPGVEQATPF